MVFGPKRRWRCSIAGWPKGPPNEAWRPSPDWRARWKRSGRFAIVERDPKESDAVSDTSRPQVEPVPENPDVRPLLGESQLVILQRYGSEQRVTDGEILFADGDRSYDMIVILEGTVDIVEHHGRIDENVIISYGPR